MLSKKVEEALNEQILMEGASSNFYLAMAVWAEQNGYSGVSDFLYKHSDEERFPALSKQSFWPSIPINTASWFSFPACESRARPRATRSNAQAGLRRPAFEGPLVQDFSSLPGDWGLENLRHARFINPPRKADGCQPRRNCDPHFPRR